MKKIFNNLLFIILYILSLLISYGYSQEELSDINTLYLDYPLVITPSLKEQKISEAPASINIVSYDEIKAKGYRTSKDIIIDLVGWYDVSDANETIAAVRGIFTSTTNIILIMINGHRMNDLNLGRWNLDQFLGLDAVDHIEFIRGPGSVLYGTGALAGVINIITKKGEKIDGSFFRNKIKSYKNTNDFESSLSIGKKIDDLDVLLNFNYLDAEGDEIPQSECLDKVPTGCINSEGYLYWDKYPKNYSFFTSIKYKKLLIDVRNDHFSRAIPRCPNGSFYVFEEEKVKPLYNEDDFYFDLKYVFDLSDTSRLTFNPSATFYHLNELTWITSYGANRLPIYGSRSGQNTRYNQYQGKIIYENQLKENFNLIFGIDSIYSDFYDMNAVSGNNGAEFTSTSVETGDWNLTGTFGQIILNFFNNLDVILSLRYDDFEDFAKSKIITRYGFIYHFSEYLKGKLLYGESYLSPQWAHKKSITTAAFVSDPNMSPETFKGIEYILEYLLNNISLSLNFFLNKADDLISASPTYAYTNLGEINYRGYELEMKYILTNQIKLNANYSFVEDSGNTSDVYLINNDIKNIPQNIFRMGLNYSPFNDTSILLWSRTYSDVKTSDSITNDNEIGGWTTFDMSINYSLKNIDLQLSCLNLFDKQYEIGGTSTRPMARSERSVSFSLGYNF